MDNKFFLNGYTDCILIYIPKFSIGVGLLVKFSFWEEDSDIISIKVPV